MLTGFAIFALIVEVISFLVSLWSVWHARAHISLLWEKKGRVNQFVWLNVLCVLLGLLSIAFNHILMVSQICESSPYVLVCSAYQHSLGAYKVVLTVSGWINGSLILVMNFICIARWSQMKANVRYNEWVKRMIAVASTGLFFWKVITAALRSAGDTASEEGDRLAVLVYVSSVVFAASSIVFDLTICLMIGYAVFQSQVRVTKGQTADQLKRQLRNFRIWLSALILVNVVQLAVTRTIGADADNLSAGFSIGVSTTMIHVVISKELLRGFCDRILSNKSSAGASNSSGSKPAKRRNTRSIVKSVSQVRGTSTLATASLGEPDNDGKQPAPASLGQSDNDGKQSAPASLGQPDNDGKQPAPASTPEGGLMPLAHDQSRQPTDLLD